MFVVVVVFVVDDEMGNEKGGLDPSIRRRTQERWLIARSDVVVGELDVVVVTEGWT